MKKAKGMRFTDRISMGDIDTKVRTIRRFLESGHPCSISCRHRKARAHSVRAADSAAEGTNDDRPPCCF